MKLFILILLILVSLSYAQGVYVPLWRLANDTLYTIRDSIFVSFNDGVAIEGILRCDSIVGGSPIYVPYIACDTLNVSGEWYRTGIQVIDDDANIGGDVSVIFVDTDKATLRLPDATSNEGRVVTIKIIQIHVDIEIGTQGGSIEGEHTFDMGKDYDTITVISDGSDWWIIASGYKI